jgi:hypothetical protein
MEASISPMLFNILYDMRNTCVQGGELAKPWFLKNKIYSKVIDVLGYVGIKIGSNPSGCFNTLSDNTLVLIFIMLYNLCCQTTDIEQVLTWYDTLPAKLMGDDSIIAESPLLEQLIPNALHLGFTLEYEVPPPTKLHEAKFLNFGFSYVWSKGMYIFKPNFDKMFANLFFNRKGNSWRLTLAKLYALRVMCFAFTRYRIELEAYISFVWEKYESEMKNEKILDEKLPFQTLRTMHLPENEIQFLLFGLENSGAQPDSKLVSNLLTFLD